MAKRTELQLQTQYKFYSKHGNPWVVFSGTFRKEPTKAMIKDRNELARDRDYRVRIVEVEVGA